MCNLSLRRQNTITVHGKVSKNISGYCQTQMLCLDLVSDYHVKKNIF